MQNYKDWKPFLDYPKGLYCQGIHDDYEGFRILMRGSTKDNMRRISFESILSYRVSDESYRLKTIDAISKLDSIGFPFFIIENSDFLSDFHSETHNIYIKWKIIHYCIYLCDNCIDILSTTEPKAEILGSDS